MGRNTYMKRTANIPRRREAGKGESGTALVMALFIITVLTVLGTMVLNTSIVEIKMAANQKVSSQVFYAAEAGLERGLLMLISDFENDTTANSPWANNNYAGWGETVTPIWRQPQCHDDAKFVSALKHGH